MNSSSRPGAIDPGRIFTFKAAAQSQGAVVYWMSREQRVRDNFGLALAQQRALAAGSPLVVVFCLAPAFLGATLRQYDFMLRGLFRVERDLARKNIDFALLMGDPVLMLPAFLKRIRAGLMTVDFDPLRVKQRWLEQVAARVDIPVLEVDSHNIVPCRLVSDKQEYSARTIRPKIQRLLPGFLAEPPGIVEHPHRLSPGSPPVPWEEARGFVRADPSVRPVDWLKPGEQAGLDMLAGFLGPRIDNYAQGRNDPNRQVLSDLSPYLHFGQLAPLRAALEAVKARPAADENAQAFLEELVVRRELSDNFCLHNNNYDDLSGGPDWGLKTLAEHARDPRPHVYAREEFERAATHSRLWNACQTEMAISGKMHGYMRMYWAKKILEWSKDPAEALQCVIYLNDRYELDGRDPNGYVGALWAVAGLHDRAWKERPVLGKIRYMNERGCRRKFDVEAYIRRWRGP